MILKLFGITLSVIIFMSLLAGVNPAEVMALLVEMPAFQLFFIFSLLVVFIFSTVKKIVNSESEKK